MTNTTDWDYWCDAWDKNKLTTKELMALAPVFFTGKELDLVLAEIDCIGETELPRAYENKGG